MSDQYHKFVWRKPLEIVRSNIPEEELEEFEKKYGKAYSPLLFVDDIKVDMGLYNVLMLRMVVKQLLESKGKHPTNEFLWVATRWLMKNKEHIKPSLNPIREHWVIKFLCDACDGKTDLFHDKEWKDK